MDETTSTEYGMEAAASPVNDALEVAGDLADDLGDGAIFMKYDG